MNSARHGYKIENILVAHPPKYPADRLPWLGKHPSIEDTGRGDTLCLEAWGFRFFYSDEGAVREGVDKFCENYREMCERVRDDLMGDCRDIVNFNDLYSLLGIVPTPFGEVWGYSTSEDYAVNLDFSVDYIVPTEDKIADAFGCKILKIEPSISACYPDYYDREY